VRDTDPRVRKGQAVDAVDHRSVNWIEWLWFGALDAPGAPDEQDAQEHDGRLRDSHQEGLPNGSRLSCGEHTAWQGTNGIAPKTERRQLQALVRRRRVGFLYK